WQDVARDLDIGRGYLPWKDRDQFGYADADLNARRCTTAFQNLMRFEVERTRQMFHAGLPLVKLMPRDLQTQTESFARGALAILRKIEAQNFDVWARRRKLCKFDKAWLMVQVVARGIAK